MKLDYFIILFLLKFVAGQYEPNWDSLDTRPIPDWYDKAKVGIFIHWGVYSVPSFGSEWFWTNWKSGNAEYENFMNKNYKPSFTYQDFAKDFTAEFFNASEWADLFAKSGAKYVVLTSKHHEGYTMWPSNYTFSWNAMDVGPNQDLLGNLSDAVRRRNLRFGIYYSLYEWFNPLYLNDQSNNWTTSNYVDNKVIPEIKSVIKKYEPEVLWSDGDWETTDTYWKSTEFIAWLYNESPVKGTVVTNDRWGSGIPCHHGDFYTCSDRYNPGVLVSHKWENAMTLDKQSWGYRRNLNISDILTTEELITTLVETVSCNGNILINVGPTKEGIIIPTFQERLLNLGKWLEINGDAIYETRPWTIQNDTLTPGVWYTTKESSVYAITLEWPENNILSLESVSQLFGIPSTRVVLLGNDEVLEWELVDGVVSIRFPDKATVISQWAWSLKINE